MQILKRDNLHESSKSSFGGKIRKIFQNILKIICMKGQSLFSGKNKKKNTLNLLPAEFAQRMVKVNMMFLSMELGVVGWCKGVV